MIETDVGTHGVGDILLGFEPKDAGSTPAGSAVFQGAGFAHPEISVLRCGTDRYRLLRKKSLPG